MQRMILGSALVVALSCERRAPRRRRLCLSTATNRVFRANPRTGSGTAE